MTYTVRLRANAVRLCANAVRLRADAMRLRANAVCLRTLWGWSCTVLRVAVFVALRARTEQLTKA